MKKGLMLSFVLFIISVAFAGGFYISVESGSSRNAALILKTSGCHTPSDAKLIGSAEGIVNGERKTVKLNFKNDKKGVFTIAKQWDDEGVWVITINAKYNGSTLNAIVEIDSKSNMKLAKGEVDYDLKVKIVKGDFNPDEVDKLLYSLNKKYSRV